MRAVFVCMSLLATVWALPVSAAVTSLDAQSSTDGALKWINTFRLKPDVKTVPAVIRGASERGALRDPESAGVYLGFLAGVLRSNPSEARAIAAKVLPLPFEDQWLLVKAVAYSDLRGWKDILRELAIRLPDRQPLIERYLTGQLPTLANATLERKSASTMDKVKGAFGYKLPEPPPQLTFDANPELIDTLWGLYFATGDSGPIIQLIALLPWAKERDNTDKLTIGSMVKYSLASNASRDVQLLALLKGLKSSQTEEHRVALTEVIEASETVQTGRLRKEALAALDELRMKGPRSRRDTAWWATVGEAGISLGCVGAAVAGQVALGLPCVVGGALSSAGLRYLGQPN